MTTFPDHDPPIGCTLDRGDLLERTADFDRLFRRALVRREASGARAVWTFAWSPETEREVRELAASERGCCSFFQFEIVRDGDELRWTLSAPPSRADAVAMLDGLAAAVIA